MTPLLILLVSFYNNPSMSNITLLAQNSPGTKKDFPESLIFHEINTLNNFVSSGGNILLMEPEIEFDLRKRDDAYDILPPKENPYALGFVVYGEYTSACSGSLLTDSWVLTAAHCLKYKGRVTRGRAIVYAGGIDLNFVREWYHGKLPLPRNIQLLVSTEFYIHDQGLDIGLIKLPAKFSLTDYVNTINLSSKPWNYRGYRQCSTTAFGTVSGNEHDRDDYKRKTQKLEIKQPCLCSFRVLLSSDSNVFTEDFLCAKPVKDYGVCFGDSGGGLVCNGQIVAVNMKIIGFDSVKYCELNIIEVIVKRVFGIQGVKCGNKDTLSVFQSTCRALPWINKYVNLFSSEEIAECAHVNSSGPLIFSQYLMTIAVISTIFLNS